MRVPISQHSETLMPFKIQESDKKAGLGEEKKKKRKITRISCFKTSF